MHHICRDMPAGVIMAIEGGAGVCCHEHAVTEVTRAPYTRTHAVLGGETCHDQRVTTGLLTEVGGYSVATQRRMESLSGGTMSTHTVISQTNLVFDEPLPADLFTERFLRR